MSAAKKPAAGRTGQGARAPLDTSPEFRTFNTLVLDDVAAQTAKKDRNGPPMREVRHQPQPIENHLNVRLDSPSAP